MKNNLTLLFLFIFVLLASLSAQAAPPFHRVEVSRIEQTGAAPPEAAGAKVLANKPEGGASEFSALQGIARILTRRGEFDEALKTLQRAQPDKLQGVWRMNILNSIETVNKARKP